MGVNAVSLIKAQDAKYREIVGGVVHEPCVQAPALAVGIVFASNGASASTFDIELNFLGGLTASQEELVTAAALYWETQITGYQEDLGLGSTVQIDVKGQGFDGPGGAWGAAEVTSTATGAEHLYSTGGKYYLDIVDVDFAESVGALLPLSMHEIAHILGFGELWSSTAYGIPGYQEVYVPGSGQYTGAYAVSAYQATVDPTAEFIPVELDLGPGSNDAHWDEDFGCAYLGCDPELMTASLEPDWFVSAYTIASFADIGYTTLVTHPAPVPPPPAVLFCLSGLGMLSLLRRRTARQTS